MISFQLTLNWLSQILCRGTDLLLYTYILYVALLFREVYHDIFTTTIHLNWSFGANNCTMMQTATFFVLVLLSKNQIKTRKLKMFVCFRFNMIAHLKIASIYSQAPEFLSVSQGFSVHSAPHKPLLDLITETWWCGGAI